MCIKEFDRFRPGTVYDIEITFVESKDSNNSSNFIVKAENKRISWNGYNTFFSANTSYNIAK
jgi:hypothetical protein